MSARVGKKRVWDENVNKNNGFMKKNIKTSNFVIQLETYILKKKRRGAVSCMAIVLLLETIV